MLHLVFHRVRFIQDLFAVGGNQWGLRSPDQLLSFMWTLRFDVLTVMEDSVVLVNHPEKLFADDALDEIDHALRGLLAHAVFRPDGEVEGVLGHDEVVAVGGEVDVLMFLRFGDGVVWFFVEWLLGKAGFSFLCPKLLFYAALSNVASYCICTRFPVMCVCLSILFNR